MRFILPLPLFMFLLALSVSSHAQTVLQNSGLPAPPPSGSKTVKTTNGSLAQTLPNGAGAKLPISDQVLEQAKDQLEGVFPPMEPNVLSPGQIQEAWNEAGDQDGVKRYAVCRDCVYKARLRQFMITAFELPAFETITSIDVGDQAGFIVQNRDRNSFAVKPTSYGLDTNILVYTKSGNIYPFYVRSENNLSEYIPDLVVKVGDGSLYSIKVKSEASESKANDTKLSLPNLPKDIATKIKEPASAPTPLMREVPFDPAKLRGFNQYEVWGNGDDMMPDMIYRDDYFTYVHFSNRTEGKDFPVAYVVQDQIDELVNTRVQNNGQTLVIESTHRLISLKSGLKFICLQYLGDA